MSASRAFPGRLRSEINIAPLVDVTMVLLIIFMAAAPLMQMGYDVTTPSPGPGSGAEPITVTLDDDGSVLLNGERIDKDALSAALSSLIAGRSAPVVFFDAGGNVGYADAVDILDLIRRAGARIGIKLEPGPQPQTEQ